MSYNLNLGKWNSIFVVPDEIVDQHLKLCTEQQLKVLLYLLRHAGHGFSSDDIAKSTGVSTYEVENAVEFWIERGVIRADETDLAPGENSNENSSSVSKEQKTDTAVPQKHTTVTRAVRPDTAFVSKLLKEDQSLKGLLEEAQVVLKKPLSPGDTAVLVMLYNSFGLPCEVIAMLIHYCASVGSANMRTIERLGINWSDNGIDSVEAAEKEIDRLTSSREAWGRVSSLLGIHNIGKPTESQMEHADRWLNIWRFSDDMIVEAYERCVNTKGEYNLRYINAILQKWFDKKILSIEALTVYEASAKRTKKPSKKGSVYSEDSASFSLSQFESKSLFDD